MTLGPAFSLFACFVGDVLPNSVNDGFGTDKLKKFVVKSDWLVNVVAHVNSEWSVEQKFISPQQFLTTNRLSSPDKTRKVLRCQLILL